MSRHYPYYESRYLVHLLHGCIGGILQSLNIALITASIIVVTTFLFGTNDTIFIPFIFQKQIPMHGSKQLCAYAL